MSFKSPESSKHRYLLHVFTLVLILATPLGTSATDLLESYQLSLSNDPQYLGAGANNRAAQELTAQALALLLPDARIRGSVTANRLKVRRGTFFAADRGSNNFSRKDLVLTITQPIFNKQLFVQLGQAKKQTSQSDVEFAFALQDLIVRVSERYFGVLAARDDLEFRQAEQEANRQQLEQSQRRFEVGLIAITDVEESQAGFDLATAEVIAAETRLDNAREALREVTGQYFEVLQPVGETMPLIEPGPNDIDAWTETALQQNLQIQAANLSTQTAFDEIQRTEMGHVPTLDLVASHEYGRSSGGGAAGRETTDIRESRIGLELNVPLYQGGLVLSQTREARALYGQSLDGLESQRRSVQRQTRDAFLGVISGISLVKARNQAVVSTRSAVEAIQAGFEVGTRTSLDVLQAQQALFEAKRDNAAARYDYILDLLRLKQAAGTLAIDDVVEVNSWLE